MSSSKVRCADVTPDNKETLDGTGRVGRKSVSHRRNNAEDVGSEQKKGLLKAQQQQGEAEEEPIIQPKYYPPPHPMPEKPTPSKPSPTTESVPDGTTSCKMISVATTGKRAIAASSVSQTDAKSPSSSERSISMPEEATTTNSSSSSSESATWQTMFENLRLYQSEHGDCLVPKLHKPCPSLPDWVRLQRRQYKLLKDNKKYILLDDVFVPIPLSPSRIRDLESLGFEWDLNAVHDTTWWKRFEELKKYKEENGDCMVPQRYPLNPKLGCWVAHQREQQRLLQDNKPSSLGNKRLKALESVGFVWSTRYDPQTVWNTRCAELRRYKSQHGNCLVPKVYKPYPQLGYWVMTQRRQYRLLVEGKQTRLNPERIRELDEVGFVWSLRPDPKGAWQKRFNELLEYKRLNGHCLVPQRHPDNPPLGIWVNTQRRHYKHRKDGRSSSMTPERIALLESVGFAWVSPK